MKRVGTAVTRSIGHGNEAGARGTWFHVLAMELQNLGRDRGYAPGEVLIEQGDRSSDLFVIRSGTVKVTTQLGSEPPELVEVRRGVDVVGEVAAFGDEPRTATVTAGDEVSARVIPVDEVKRFFADHPHLGLAFLNKVTLCLSRSNRRRLEFVRYSVKERVARALVELAMPRTQRGRMGIPLPIELTQDELASLIGSKPRSVELALKELRGRGLVATGRRQITVLDLVRLMEVARMSMSDQRRIHR